MRRGAAAIIMVLFVTIAGLFVLAAWQSRLLLAVQRRQSVSDALAATYAAESEIYDWVARFLGDYPELFNPALTDTARNIKSQTLPDGTKLNVSGQLVDGDQTLLVTANRQFASTNIRLSRSQSEETSDEFDSLEIGLALDCTTSMNEPATAACRDTCCSGATCDNARFNNGTGSVGYRNCMTANGCATRIAEEKKAALGFVDAAADFASENADKEVRLGVAVFRLDAAWAQTPVADLGAVRSAVEGGLGRWHSGSGGSPMCGLITGSTSIGSGFDLMNRDLEETAQTRRKQVEVLISDGEPNSRNAGYTPACAGTVCSGGGCASAARQYLECSLRPLRDDGSRDEAVDAYAVTVLDSPPVAVTDIFNEWATRYYNSADATNLGGILAGIFDQIVTQFSTINIKRLVPTPIR